MKGIKCKDEENEMKDEKKKKEERNKM